MDMINVAVTSFIRIQKRNGHYGLKWLGIALFKSELEQDLKESCRILLVGNELV